MRLAATLVILLLSTIPTLAADISCGVIRGSCSAKSPSNSFICSPIKDSDDCSGNSKCQWNQGGARCQPKNEADASYCSGFSNDSLCSDESLCWWQGNDSCFQSRTSDGLTYKKIDQCINSEFYSGEDCASKSDKTSCDSLGGGCIWQNENVGECHTKEGIPLLSDISACVGLNYNACSSNTLCQWYGITSKTTSNATCDLLNSEDSCNSSSAVCFWSKVTRCIPKTSTNWDDVSYCNGLSSVSCSVSNKCQISTGRCQTRNDIGPTMFIDFDVLGEQATISDLTHSDQQTVVLNAETRDLDGANGIISYYAKATNNLPKNDTIISGNEEIKKGRVVNLYGDVLSSILIDNDGYRGKTGKNASDICADKIKSGQFGSAYLTSFLQKRASGGPYDSDTTSKCHLDEILELQLGLAPEVDTSLSCGSACRALNTDNYCRSKPAFVCENNGGSNCSNHQTSSSCLSDSGCKLSTSSVACSNLSDSLSCSGDNKCDWVNNNNELLCSSEANQTSCNSKTNDWGEGVCTWSSTGITKTAVPNLNSADATNIAVSFQAWPVQDKCAASSSVNVCVACRAIDQSAGSCVKIVGGASCGISSQIGCQADPSCKWVSADSACLSNSTSGACSLNSSCSWSSLYSDPITAPGCYSTSADINGVCPLLPSQTECSTAGAGICSWSSGSNTCPAPYAKSGSTKYMYLSAYNQAGGSLSEIPNNGYCSSLTPGFHCEDISSKASCNSNVSVCLWKDPAGGTGDDSGACDLTPRCSANTKLSVTTRQKLKGFCGNPNLCSNYTDEPSCGGTIGCAWNPLDGTCIKGMRTSSVDVVPFTNNVSGDYSCATDTSSYSKWKSMCSNKSTPVACGNAASCTWNSDEGQCLPNADKALLDEIDSTDGQMCEWNKEPESCYCNNSSGNPMLNWLYVGSQRDPAFAVSATTPSTDITTYYSAGSSTVYQTQKPNTSVYKTVSEEYYSKGFYTCEPLSSDYNGICNNLSDANSCSEFSGCQWTNRVVISPDNGEDGAANGMSYVVVYDVASVAGSIVNGAAGTSGRNDLSLRSGSVDYGGGSCSSILNQTACELNQNCQWNEASFFGETQLCSNKQYSLYACVTNKDYGWIPSAAQSNPYAENPEIHINYKKWKVFDVHASGNAGYTPPDNEGKIIVLKHVFAPAREYIKSLSGVKR